MSTQRPGAITLIATFFTAMVALMLLLTVNIHAVDEKQRTHDSTISEQAFYAAQSCLDETLLRLGSDTSYTGVTTPITVGNAICKTVVTPSATGGSVISTGISGNSIRSISSTFASSVTTVRQHTQIFHVIDRSGSMGYDGTGCVTVTDFGQLCGDQPFTSVKAATIQFNLDHMVPAYDKVGVVSFIGDHDSTTFDAQLNQSLTSDKNMVDSTINLMPNPDPYAETNIGDGLKEATNNFISPTTDTRVIILLTDGVPNSDCNDSCTETIAQTAKDNGIIVFAIGFGSVFTSSNTHFTQATNLMNSIASIDPHTHLPLFFTAHDTTALSPIYTQIAGIIQSIQIQQGSWNEQ